MAKEIVKKQTKLPVDLGYAGFAGEEVQLIKETIVPTGTSDAEFRAFLMLCSKKRLDPFQRQIYLIPRWDNKNNKNRMVPQTSIDGLRAIAARTGVYAGCDDFIFDSEVAPKKVSVTVYRLVNGIRCPFTASARWDQYYPGDKIGMMWKKMPHVMLGKVAEALALRKAFPEDLSGLYTDDEMQQAEKHGTHPLQNAYPTVSPTAIAAQSSNQVDEETKEAKDYLKERLVGKYGLFPNDFKGARAFITESVKKTFEQLTADDCQEIIARIDANIEPEEQQDIDARDPLLYPQNSDPREISEEDKQQ